MACKNLPCALFHTLLLFHWGVETLQVTLKTTRCRRWRLSPFVALNERVTVALLHPVTWARNKLVLCLSHYTFFSPLQQLAYTNAYMSFWIQLFFLCAEVPMLSPPSLNFTINQGNRINKLKFKQPLGANDTHQISGHSIQILKPEEQKFSRVSLQDNLIY